MNFCQYSLCDIDLCRNILMNKCPCLVDNSFMKKNSLSISDIRVKINELVGKNICMEVCRGRKQVKKYNGVVENTFPSVFVVRLTEGGHVVDSLSYSYSDVLCGEVIIAEAK